MESEIDYEVDYLGNKIEIGDTVLVCGEKYFYKRVISHFKDINRAGAYVGISEPGSNTIRYTYKSRIIKIEDHA